jgi:hypothetical protein
MDITRAHEVTWLPTPDPPQRYFDRARNLCVTVQGGTVQKVTLADDPAGLPFVNAGQRGFAPCSRSLSVKGGQLMLHDGGRATELPLPSSWGVTRDSGAPDVPLLGPGWRDLFEGGSPNVEPRDAYGAVLLYPEDGTEVGEAATQPFVADYLQDQLEHDPELAASLAGSERVLIQGFEAALLSCVSLDRPRDHCIVYGSAAFAQKHAQALWNQLARARKLEWATQIRFLPWQGRPGGTEHGPYDLIYGWVPFGQWPRVQELQALGRELAGQLRTGALAFVAGPRGMRAALQAAGLRVVQAEAVETLPTVRMHRTILPQTSLKPDLVLFRVRRG